MIKIKITRTGRIKEVSNNEAHGLIESGLATIYKGKVLIGGFSLNKRYKTKGR